MGITTSKVIYSTPNWFPRHEFESYIHGFNELKLFPEAEQKIFNSIACKIAGLNFVGKAKITRVKSWPFGLFKHIYCQVIPQTKTLPFKMSGLYKHKPGITISSGAVYECNTMLTKLRYFPMSDLDLLLVYNHPLINNANFKKNKIFPLLSFKLSQSATDFYNQSTRISTGTSTITSANGSSHFTLGFSLFKNISFDESQIPFIEEPAQYYKSFLSFYQNYYYRLPVLFASKIFQTRFLESGFITHSEKINPFAKAEFHVSIKPKFYASVHIAAGAMVSKNGMPIFERFHLGGVPEFRGIASNEFSLRCNNTPIGNDAFLAFGIDQEFPIFYKKKFSSHVFVNAAVSTLRMANYCQSQLPSLSAFLGYGAGFKFRVLNTQMEVNFELPAYNSQHLQYVWFQMNADTITPKD